MSYAEIVHEAETEFGAGGGSKFKFKEGENKIRILAAARPYQSTYNGQKKTNYIHWIIDRFDGKVKLAFLPYTIVKALAEFEKSDDYGFSEFPMPYDVTVRATHAGTKEVEYTVIPAKQETALSEQEVQEFEKKQPIDQVRDKLKAKEEALQAGEDDEISVKDIPM